MNEIRLKILHLTVLTVLVSIVFLPSIGGEFVNWDDQSHVVDNPAVRSFDLKEMFTQTVQKIYIPLTTLTFAVEHKLFGQGPFVYHLDNLLLHVTNTALVYWLIVRLGVPLTAAFWAALLFGIHPMRVESVAWVTERKDLLYAFFYLLALLSYLRDLQCRGTACRAPTVFYWAALVFGILSLLAKPMALSLPLILLLVDWFKGRALDRRIFLEKVPFFLYVVPITWITYAHHVRNPVGDLGQAALTWIWTFNFYIWKFIWPHPLVPVYHIPESGHVAYFLSLIFFVVLTIAIIRFRSSRWWLFAVGYYLFSIFFLLRFDAGKDINIVADRFMYLPSLGFCVLFGLGIRALLEPAVVRKNILRLIVPLAAWGMIGALSFKSMEQIHVWNNTISLWTHVIKYNPTEFLAYNDRAVGYISRGFYDLGIADYSSILKFDADNEDAFYNRGLAYKKIAQYAPAISDFTEVIRQFPHYEKAYLHRGMSYEALGNRRAALDDYNRTVAASPDFPDGYLNRGNMFNHEGQLNEALMDYNRAIVLSPRFERAINNRGTVYAKLSDNSRALDDFNTAIALDPDYAEAYFNRSVIYQRMNKREAALSDALKARFLGAEVPAEYIHSLQ